ncbi:MAG: ABC transporter permease [Desulfobulbaceae bacterium]|nr:ABC transporter permease [Desulfobulbaceae bacterium]
MNKFVSGALLLILLIFLALGAPLVSPADPLAINMAERLQSVSMDHPMGTDQLGRDLFSRILYAARTSLSMTGIVMLLCVLIGMTVGCIAGFFGGTTDDLLMRLVDLLMSFPSFIITIAITGLLGSSVFNVILALSLTTWTGYARIIRGSVLIVKEELYVEAAMVMGRRRRHIIKDHIIPNAISPLLVYAAIHSGHTILAVTGLSFMGLGAQPPTPEWGGMLNEASSFMGSQPNLFVFPGLAIMLTVLAFNLLGEGLRDLLDPNLREMMKI